MLGLLSKIRAGLSFVCILLWMFRIYEGGDGRRDASPSEAFPRERLNFCAAAPNEKNCSGLTGFSVANSD